MVEGEIARVAGESAMVVVVNELAEGKSKLVVEEVNIQVVGESALGVGEESVQVVGVSVEMVVGNELMVGESALGVEGNK